MTGNCQVYNQNKFLQKIWKQCVQEISKQFAQKGNRILPRSLDCPSGLGQISGFALDAVQISGSVKNLVCPFKEYKFHIREGDTKSLLLRLLSPSLIFYICFINWYFYLLMTTQIFSTLSKMSTLPVANIQRRCIFINLYFTAIFSVQCTNVWLCQSCEMSQICQIYLYWNKSEGDHAVL